jgi:predicted amidohydrolase YtcJ
MSAQLRNFLIFLLSLVIIAVMVVELSPQAVDTNYINGVVYTLDEENSAVQAFAVSGDRILGTGTTSAIERKFKAKTTVDLKGRTVLPGFIDSHAHFLSLGISRLTVDLLGTSSEQDAAGRVKLRVAKISPDQWVRGRGWDQNGWPGKQFPGHASLDRVAPDNPVYLVRVDGHAAWVNKKGMQIAGITKATADPAGGRIVRDSQGNPSGVFVDNAMQLVYTHIPQMSDSEAVEAMQLAAQECVQYGLTTVHDMGVDSLDIELYKRLIRADKFPLRIYGAIGGVGDLWSKFLKDGPLVGFGNNKLTIRALKLYVDGALGSRGAALIEPYSDDPANRGLTVTSEDLIRSATIDALRGGFQVCTHAIGDRGNNIVLRMYDAALREVPKNDHRLRIEHAQVLDANDIPKFKALGVIPSMQPTHCTSDMFWAEARLGPHRVRGAYAWRSLLNTGVVIPGGSDFPVENPNPILGVYAAVSRKDNEGRPRDAEDGRRYFQFSSAGMTDTTAFNDGWYPSEKMTRLEALRSYTTWGAWAGFEELLKGALRKGMLADFVVLSSDIIKVPEKAILDVRVLKTFVGGMEVYSNGD